MSAPYAEHLAAWLEGEVAPDLAWLAAYAVAPEAEWSPADIEDRLTADLEAAIAAVAAVPGLTSDARRLHGLTGPAPVPAYLRGLPLPQLVAQLAGLVQAWGNALGKASYRADKLTELEDAPHSAAAAGAVARWGLLDGGPRMPGGRAVVDMPAELPLPIASKTDLHKSVFGHTVRFFTLADDAEAKPPRMLLTAETGSAKTGIALQHLHTMIERRKAAGRPHRVAWLVPAHRLGREALSRAELVGINAASFRGRGDASKPDQPCRNLEAVALAQHVGGDVRSTVCGPGPDGGRCTWRDTCGYLAGLARAKAADLVIVAHDFLFVPLPKELQHDLAWVVVDEGFANLADRSLELTLGTLSPESLAHAPVLCDDQEDEDATAELGRLHAMIEAAARGCMDGYLTADALRTAGFTAVSDAPARMRKLSWKRERKIKMWPGMDLEARKDAARQAASNGHLRKIAALTHALEAMLTGGKASAGLVSVHLHTNRRGSETVLTVRGQKEPSAWLADLPVLMLDATGRIEDVRRVFPDAELAEAPRAAWPYCEVRQITGGFGQSTLARHPTRSAELRDLALLNTLGKPDALLVTHKRHEATFAGIPGLATAHHGDIAGLDAHAAVDTAFIIGGAFASPDTIASIAAARGGGALPVTKPERMLRTGLLASGAGVGIECMGYPNTAADTAHRGIYDASIIQAVGRVRPLERTERNPVVVYVFANVTLPFPVASVTPWKDLRPDRLVRMIAAERVFSNAADMAAYHLGLFATPKAAEAARRRAAGTVQDMREAVRNTVKHDRRAWVEIIYQPSGQGQRTRSVWCPAGADRAVLTAVEAETGTPVRWRVARFTPGREDTLTPGILDTYPRVEDSSPAPDVGPAAFRVTRPSQVEERPPDG